MKKKNCLVLDFFKVKYQKKKKKKDKAFYSPQILITILNIYNPLNNIKFTKEKKVKKKFTWYLIS